MEQRKLAATLFADIEGYTLMMQKDERLALSVQARFKNLIEEYVPNHSGEIIQFYGDGCLLLFDSSTHAVTCGKELQFAFIKQTLPVRIGIHVGDVLLKEGIAYGNSINLSSRIESMAVTGSVLFSQTVADQIRNKSDFNFRSLGFHHFKNVEKPMEVFALDHPDLSFPDLDNLTGKFAPPKPLESPEPSESKINTRNKKFFLMIGSVAILMIFLAFWFMRPDSPSEKTDTQHSDLAILPFHLTGVADMNYLSHAIPDLLSNKIEGIGGLKMADPNAIIGLLGEDRIIRDPAEATKIIQKLSAEKFILGSITSLPNQFTITASLYGKNGRKLAQESVISHQKEDLPNLVDELTHKLIVSNLNLKNADVLKTGAISTSNLDALKLFFEGEKNRREYKFHEAIESYKAAFEMDSTFAMALYRLVFVENQLFGSIPEYNRILKLKTLKAELPRKYQLLTDALFLYLGHNAKKSIGAYQDILTDYPNDVETNLMMGEALFHLNPLIGSPFSDARPYFERVIKYDSSNLEAIKHLELIYILDKDTSKLRHLLTLYAKPGLYSEYYEVFISQDSMEQEKYIKKLASKPIFIAAAFLASCNCTDHLLQAFYALERIRKIKIPVQDDAAQVMETIVRGKEDAIEQFNNPFLRTPAILMTSSIIGHPEIPAFENKYPFLFSSLSSSAPIFEKLPFTSVSNINEIKCQLALVMEQPDTFNYYLNLIRKKGKSDPDFSDYVLFWEHYLGGIRDFRNKKYESAESHFAKLDDLTYPLSDNQTKTFNRPLARFMRGDMLMKQEKWEEALGWFENFMTEPISFPLIPWTYQRRAFIYENQGRTQKAIEYYGKFISFYEDSAPQYQTFIQEAQVKRESLMSKLN